MSINSMAFNAGVLMTNGVYGVARTVNKVASGAVETGSCFAAGVMYANEVNKTTHARASLISADQMAALLAMNEAAKAAAPVIAPEPEIVEPEVKQTAVVVSPKARAKGSKLATA